MRRPRALDLFCGAGGASMGLFLAGFDVAGVDIKPQPRYPFTFHQGDALEADVRDFDFIWASPPCQAFSQMTPRATRAAHQDLVEPTRDKLRRSGLPYIIENVERSPLRDPVKLDGAMFGLGVIRIRWFESPVFLMTPRPVRRAACVADWCSVFGNGSGPTRRANGKSTFVSPGLNNLPAWKRAMGIDWMTRRELTQAIPPAYSEFLARQVLQSLKAAA